MFKFCKKKLAKYSETFFILYCIRFTCKQSYLLDTFYSYYICEKNSCNIKIFYALITLSRKNSDFGSYLQIELIFRDFKMF